MHSLKVKGRSFHKSNLSVHHFECETNNGPFHLTDWNRDIPSTSVAPRKLVQYILIWITQWSKQDCDVMTMKVFSSGIMRSIALFESVFLLVLRKTKRTRVVYLHQLIKSRLLNCT